MNKNIDALHQIALATEDLERSIGFDCDVLALPLIASVDPPGLAFFRDPDEYLLSFASRIKP